MSTLVIVESPAKAKKIQSYLGKDYVVRASIGHIRDLPANKLEIPERYAAERWASVGVDVQNNFRPIYVIPKTKQEVVRSLRAEVKKADKVILATDADREGEAIAWHLTQALKLPNTTERMVFHEITADAILAAVQNTRPLDFALVGAQEARRILDRLYGYGVSPVLWRNIGPKLSAGRVQSAALGVLAKRELARMSHVPAAFWRITAKLKAQAGKPFIANVTAVKGQPIAVSKDYGTDGKLKNDSKAIVLTPQQAEKVVEFLKSKPILVKNTTTTPYSTRPPAPFTTSTLQQAASSNLKMSPQQSMSLAQKLYEGGHITYMRTDSPSLSEEAMNAARAIATQLFGAAAVPAQPRVYAAKGQNAQEAHEAIRPSGKVFKAPAQTGLSSEELSLYELIYNRTVASQMIDLQGEKTVLNLACGAVLLEASGKVILEAGFTKLYQDLTLDEDQTQQLPHVVVGEVLITKEAKAEQKSTPAPGRFSEASLVKALESAGVGRPSTYASILNTLDTRGYTRVVKRQLTVTWLGLLVSTYLAEQFEEVVNSNFTASMETDLDRIASGELKRVEYLTQVWTNGIEQVIKRAKAKTPVLQVPRVLGAMVTARAEGAILILNGKAMPISPELVPDDLTEALAERIMNGDDLTKPIKKAKVVNKKVAKAKVQATPPLLESGVVKQEINIHLSI